MHRMAHKPNMIVFAIMVLASLLFVWGAARQGRLVNTDMTLNDQTAYMAYARTMHETHFGFIGDRAKMPAYPMFMALQYEDGMSDAAFFERGKTTGIIFAWVVLAAFFGVCARYVSAFEAMTATLVAAFTMLAYKAPYFQAEIPFYGVAFLMFAAMLELIARPRWWVALAIGVLAALGHLLKSSVAPALFLCLVCLAMRMLGEVMGKIRDPEHTTRARGRRAAKTFLCGALLTVIYIGVISPYLIHSKQQYGHYTYNVSSTLYMWYDSWDEVKAGARAHDDRIGWPSLPPDQIPSLGKYVREHTAAQALHRVGLGVLTIGLTVVRAFGYVWFFLFYLAALAWLFWRGRAPARAWLGDPVHWILGFFVAGYFGGYTLAYAWYTAIAHSHRFVLAMFLPALFVIVRMLGWAGRERLEVPLAGRRVTAPGLSAVVLAALAAYVAVVFPCLIRRVYGGN